jgi:hypothetical protein
MCFSSEVKKRDECLSARDQIQTAGSWGKLSPVLRVDALRRAVEKSKILPFSTERGIVDARIHVHILTTDDHWVHEKPRR